MSWCRFSVFKINFEQISRIIFEFLLMILYKVNAGWEVSIFFQIV